MHTAFKKGHWSVEKRDIRRLKEDSLKIVRYSTRNASDAWLVEAKDKACKLCEGITSDIQKIIELLHVFPHKSQCDGFHSSKPVYLLYTITTAFPI